MNGPASPTTDAGQRVRAANRRFYDLAAGLYDEADGRRGHHLPAWLDAIVAELALAARGGTLLDVGAGTGWLLRGCPGRFRTVVAVDLSAAVLRRIGSPGVSPLAAAAESLPLRDASVDCVSAFAVLHHIHDAEPLLREAFRVLRPGGVFYCDHDLDGRFMQRFRPAMCLYRKLSNAQRRYERADPRLDPSLYAMTEIHNDGIDVESLLTGLSRQGFSEIDASFHWLGLGRPFDLTFGRLGRRGCGPGWAPLASVRARKPANGEIGSVRTSPTTVAPSGTG